MVAKSMRRLPKKRMSDGAGMAQRRTRGSSGAAPVMSSTWVGNM